MGRFDKILYLAVGAVIGALALQVLHAPSAQAQAGSGYQIVAGGEDGAWTVSTSGAVRYCRFTSGSASPLVCFSER